MIVQFGAKLQHGNIVVRAARDRRGPLGDIVARIPGLRVEYNNHFWDSESDDSKSMYRCYAEALNEIGDAAMTPEKAQKIVEDFVMNHPWRDRVDGSRIYITDSQGEVVQPSTLPVTCLSVKFDDEGNTSLCGKEVAPGESHCVECMEAMTAPAESEAVNA